MIEMDVGNENVGQVGEIESDPTQATLEIQQARTRACLDQCQLIVAGKQVGSDHPASTLKADIDLPESRLNLGHSTRRFKYTRIMDAHARSPTVSTVECEPCTIKEAERKAAFTFMQIRPVHKPLDRTN